ncbi:MAG TPA: polysaccharide deacetylase family protein [Allosphingosinicella sp.]|nr:polysaccharide deacetylase family protein [Allosphingosinicella sp.]
MTALKSDEALELLVVVDTEEEFEWDAPFSRAHVSTRSVQAQHHAQAIYDRLGLTPTYVIGYPVARDPLAVSYLRRLQEEGRAEIGAHLHPWVTPPHHETISPRNSYQCNLPPKLERAKIEALTEAIESAFGTRPTVFKAGRHGFGKNTARAIADLGYQIDCSQLPHNDLRGDGGPDFRRVPDQPYWLEEAPGLLEIPATTGFIGRAPGLGTAVSWLFDQPVAARLHLPGVLSRSGWVARSRLTPEGVSAAEQCRLLDTLVRSGRRTFSLVYHSPSLAAGHTPYVRTEAELHRFLATIEEVLTYFRDVIGGRFTTLSGVYDRMSAAGPPANSRVTSSAPAPSAHPWARTRSPDTSGAPGPHWRSHAQSGS